MKLREFIVIQTRCRVFTTTRFEVERMDIKGLYALKDAGENTLSEELRNRNR
jgi:hypothetical protein